MYKQGYDFKDFTDTTANSYVKDVSVDGMNLQYVPKMYYNKDLVITALKQNGMALQHVKLEDMSKEMIDIAFNQNVDSFRLIPHKFLDYQIIEKAVTRNGYFLYYVPPPLRTEELMLRAVSNYPEAIKIHQCNQLMSVCYLAVMKNSKVIQYIEDKFKTLEMITNMDLFLGIEEYIPLEFKSTKLVKKLHDYYESKGYTKVGPLFIKLDYRILTNPPKYYIIDEDGSSRCISIILICEILAKHNIADPFTKDTYERMYKNRDQTRLMEDTEYEVLK
jgi:hypothetical protein